MPGALNVWRWWSGRVSRALCALLVLLTALWLHPLMTPRAAATSALPRCFTETEKCIQSGFLAYWEANGGLPIFGYPLTNEFSQQLEDGQTYTVQYFERVRMEYHPEQTDSRYQVLLGQFGRRIHPADPPVAPLPGATFFPQTGHNVSGAFLTYWQQNGGLAQFGFPLSEVIRERLEDGNEYDVQYFERARFEYHPENAGTPYDVLLGQFGQRILAEYGLGPVPPARPCRAADLRAQGSWEGISGMLLATIVVTNRGATACTLQGQPGIQMIGGLGDVLPVQQVDAPGTAEPVTLQPGQRAAMTFLWRNWCRVEPLAPITSRLTLPGSRDEIGVPPINEEGNAQSGIPQCENAGVPSTVTVSPFTPAGPAPPATPAQ